MGNIENIGKPQIVEASPIVTRLESQVENTGVYYRYMENIVVSLQEQLTVLNAVIEQLNVRVASLQSDVESNLVRNEDLKSELDKIYNIIS